MIHEIFPHRLSINYLANKRIGEKDYILHYNGNSLLLKTNGDDLKIPQKVDLPAISDNTENIFLFTLNDVSCFLIWDNMEADKSHFIYKEIDFF